MNLFCVTAILVALAPSFVSAKPALDADRQQPEFGIPMLIGGQDATSGQFPYMMSLEYYGVTGWVHVCGMTLIRPYYALSSARCVHNINVVNLRGYAGMLVRHNYTNVQQVTFNQIVVHPLYDPYTSGSLGDIAVLRFGWPADTSRPDIGFVPLPPDDTNDFVNPSCITVGWGRYSTDQTFAWTLQWVQLPTITNNACYQLLAGVNPPFDDTIICTMSDPPGAGPCSGDAGGPLLCAPVPGDSFPLYAVGITSYTTMTNNMCNENTPVVYTRVSKYLQWISDNTP